MLITIACAILTGCVLGWLFNVSQDAGGRSIRLLSMGLFVLSFALIVFLAIGRFG